MRGLEGLYIARYRYAYDLSVVIVAIMSIVVPTIAFLVSRPRSCWVRSASLMLFDVSVFRLRLHLLQFTVMKLCLMRQRHAAVRMLSLRSMRWTGSCPREEVKPFVQDPHVKIALPQVPVRPNNTRHFLVDLLSSGREVRIA